MFKINLKNIIKNFIIIISIFLADRFSKIYILKMTEIENTLDIYVNSYLNLYLIWNKGIAFGLLSFSDAFIYNIVTFIIILITLMVLLMLTKSEGFQKYCLLSVLGGSWGNLFDRVYYSAVPDFIDFHIKDFHWFVFNVADIFITLGIMCLILVEVFINNKKGKKNG